MVYHLRYWKQVRDFCRIDPTFARDVAFRDNHDFNKLCPRYDWNAEFVAAVECSRADSQEGFEACLLMHVESVCGVRNPSPEQVEEYFKAWDKVGELAHKFYETHKL